MVPRPAASCRNSGALAAYAAVLLTLATWRLRRVPLAWQPWP